MFNPLNADTICAPATASGRGAIGLIRISGAHAFSIITSVFSPVSKKFDTSKIESHKLYFGTISDNKELIDEVLVAFFKAPHSYTGDDIVEISFHGSSFIKKRILELLISKGARMAQNGEFTQRAFLNKKMDLAQSEAVADLIDSQSAVSHKIAIKQMRGGYSKKLRELRQQLLDFASLIELELDFGEEDVEFADRKQFFALLENLTNEISKLKNSFQKGNVLKTGIPVAIIGKPNAGKSTLLNTLLQEDRAIVSNIPGTTRDTIEEAIDIDGIHFRFIDTAGLRQSENNIETIGIEKTHEQIEKASVILYIFDSQNEDKDSLAENIKDLKSVIRDKDYKIAIPIANKCDNEENFPRDFKLFDKKPIFLSAKTGLNIEKLTKELTAHFSDTDPDSEQIVTNSRHYEALIRALESLENVNNTFAQDLPIDLATTDIRMALYHIGSITGEISNTDILGNIFSRFCIGK